jgi:hypothetical protein
MSLESKKTFGLQEKHRPTEEEFQTLINNERIPAVFTFIKSSGPNLHMLVIPPEGTKLGDTVRTLPLQTYIFIDKNGKEIGEATKHWLTENEASLYKEKIKKETDVIIEKMINKQAFVADLYNKVKTSSEDSQQALNELSRIAMGGNKQAKQFIFQIDHAVKDEKLNLPSEKLTETAKVKIKSKLSDYMFLAAHPLLTLKTARRRSLVSLNMENPPSNSTIEEFYMSSLVESAKLLKKAEENEKGGVPKSAWSEADQKRLEKGEKPLGHPNHPNV